MAATKFEPTTTYFVKRTLNHLAKLAYKLFKWLNCVVSIYLYGTYVIIISRKRLWVRIPLLSLYYFGSLFWFIIFVIFIIEMYSKSNKTSNMYLFLRKQLTAFTYFTLYFKLLILNKCLIVSLSPQVKWSMIISNKLVCTNCQTSYRKTWVWVVGNYKYQKNLKTS